MRHHNLRNWIFFTSLEGINSFTFNCKITLESVEKLSFSRAEKHPDFQVTLCRQNDTTNSSFAYIRSEIIPIFCENLDISQKNYASIGLSIR
jgi:hypothetical protein